MPTDKPTPIPSLSEKDIARFHSRIKRGSPNECWPWRTGTKHARFYAQGAKLNAHRVAYFLATGIDPGKALICHSCDFPPCCNPAHLHPGTNLTNMQEAAERGRMCHGERWHSIFTDLSSRSGDNHWARAHPEMTKKGEAHPKAKLTPDQVIDIRRRRAEGERLISLANKFNISIPAVYSIVTRKNWKHIP